MAKKLPKPTSDKFLRQYLETMLWSTNDNSDESGGDPLDKNYGISDISDELLASSIKDCNAFIKMAGEKLDQAGDDEQNGHDFWLTRNGHGAGFWDRGYGPVGDELSRMAKTFGGYDPHVGDNGKIY
jgi:hypothetical protein